ncbi:hypothetical protein FSC37_18190 [Piscinibacter aquaticus]|uniref:Uncharacterized protein n=1 Tax=Piscinibacter aquaticus TaxID=392597 RepID=A0A5C6U5E8_9BURK|nr:hypothetical protein FSC37_18190 [Piscinibacter aquaticus]
MADKHCPQTRAEGGHHDDSTIPATRAGERRPRHPGRLRRRRRRQRAAPFAGARCRLPRGTPEMGGVQPAAARPAAHGGQRQPAALHRAHRQAAARRRDRVTAVRLPDHDLQHDGHAGEDRHVQPGPRTAVAGCAHPGPQPSRRHRLAGGPADPRARTNQGVDPLAGLRRQLPRRRVARPGRGEPGHRALVAGAAMATPSSIQFTMHDYTSDKSFALKAGMSGKYMGFSASASGSVDTQANERTVMVYFVEKMFEVVVEPPSTPLAFFSPAFTQDKLDEQIAMGRIGPNNLPVYVSNVVYGRMMAFTFTSTASSSEIKAALNAAYKGMGSFSAEAQAAYKKTLSEARISITSLGGPSAATVDMIASGDWHSYFNPGQPAPLTSAYPLSYTFRNLGDGSIAKVSEGTEYKVKECVPAGGGGFVLDSFEVDSADTLWQVTAPPAGATSPVAVNWRPAATPQSIFYGYEAVTHTNKPLTDTYWNFDVGYITAPSRFLGDMRPYYRGELSFWYKPDEQMHGQAASSTQYCWTHWILYFPPIWETRCATLQTAIPADVPLKPTDRVYIYDDQTTADQIVLRGGGTDAAGTLLTLTYNPKQTERRMSHGWQKLVLSLSNDDSAGARLCADDDPRGCWMVEDRIATEGEIQYVLGDLKEFRIRASYPVYATLPVCSVDPLPAGTPLPQLRRLGEPDPARFRGRLLRRDQADAASLLSCRIPGA